MMLSGGGRSDSDGRDANASPPSMEQIVERVRQTLDRERATRGLSVMVNGAWQIFHGILAYGGDFEVDTPNGRVRALEYFADGGTCDGFDPQPGDAIGPEGQPGLRVELEPSTKIGQGHRDQWLAVIAQAGAKLTDRWIVDDRTYRVADWLRQAEWDVPLNYEAEFSWTLIPLSRYRPTDYRWTARDGETYSTELLVEAESMVDLQASVCGGTHRLIGLAAAVNKRIAEGKPMTRVWIDASEHLKAAIELARVNQNPDGSYSTSYLHRTGWCRDLGQMLGTTGHVLEFLAVTADRETLKSDWVGRSAWKLCQILDHCQGIDLECGVLYHALHGLVEYRRRVG
jgi:hypothetical protein